MRWVVRTAMADRRQAWYSSSIWRKLRPVIFARDGYACQLRLPGCTGVAEEVDHIIRPADGGARFDTANLRSSCRFCNRKRGGRAGAAITNGGLSQKVPASREW